MNLNNFGIYIDDTILMRGHDYYERGYVSSLGKVEPNVYVAKVEGTYTYTVYVKLDGQLSILESNCDCPYDWGEYCKHQVAVFLALGNMTANGTDIPVLESHSAKKYDDDDFRELLDSKSKEEIIEILLEVASENSEIKQRIVLDFEKTNDEDELMNAVSLINTYFDKNCDIDGYVEYRRSGDAVYGAEIVLEKSRSVFEDGEGIRAINLCLCVLGELTTLIQFADTSDGEFHGVIDEAFEQIDDILLNTEFSPEEKADLMDKLMEEANRDRYGDWKEWRLNFIWACSLICDTPDLRDRLEKHIEACFGKIDKDSWDDDYFAQKINLIRYQIIQSIDGEEKAEEFLEKNLHFSSFRKISIEHALQKKDYGKVIMLAHGGEIGDKEKPGLVIEWKRHRYGAYKALGMMEEQRKMAMDFIFSGKFEFYMELKETYGADEWALIYPEIIDRMMEQRDKYWNIYPRILIEEDEKERLLEYVNESPHLIENYHIYLVPEYENEAYDLFAKHIGQMASRASDRRAYRRVCDIIEKLKEIGGNEQAQEVKRVLSLKYSRRPAFLDELSRV